MAAARPPKPAPKRDRRLNLSLSDEEYGRLEEAAERRGEPVSVTARSFALALAEPIDSVHAYHVARLENDPAPMLAIRWRNEAGETAYTEVCETPEDVDEAIATAEALKVDAEELRRRRDRLAELLEKGETGFEGVSLFK